MTVDWATPDWALITAGGWSGRWDASVGSMTVTSRPPEGPRLQRPVLLHAGPDDRQHRLRHQTLEGLAGKTVCVGEATTYLDWLEGKKLDFGTMSPTTTPPAGVKVDTQKTDAQCPQLWGAGRNDFEGFLSSSTTVEGAIKAGLPLVKVGDPVYAEPLAVAVDKAGPDPTDFVAAVTRSSRTCMPTARCRHVDEVVRPRPDQPPTQ